MPQIYKSAKDTVNWNEVADREYKAMDTSWQDEWADLRDCAE